nr:SDR family NAD(P)-dependent oxidoreductase [Actinomycetota bacterium]
IQIGSALAFRGIPLQSAYCGAKHALNGFLDSVRAELVHDGSKVRVSSVHLPAMNTPQFEQVLNKTGRHGQPVAPIYQPELAARAVRWSADHPRRREVWVGMPTVGTIWGGRLAPRLLDRYLGRTGYAGQQTDQPWPLDAPHYLYDPVEGDKGAHGGFDEQSHARSVQQPLSRHHGVVVTGALLAGLTAAGALRSRSNSRSHR